MPSKLDIARIQEVSKSKEKERNGDKILKGMVLTMESGIKIELIWKGKSVQKLESEFSDIRFTESGMLYGLLNKESEVQGKPFALKGQINQAEGNGDEKEFHPRETNREVILRNPGQIYFNTTQVLTGDKVTNAKKKTKTKVKKSAW